jgi:hypothetical protein
MNLLKGLSYCIFLICFTVGFSSCRDRNISNDDIDKFILKHQNESFDSLKGISVFQRSRTIDKIVYGVGKSEENKPPYFVEFNLARQSISKINKTLLKKGKVTDYLTETEIANAVKTIRRYDFFLLTVDSLENVFINPFYAEAPVYLLRLKVATGDSVVRKGYVYKLYKDNWYINEQFWSQRY